MAATSVEERLATLETEVARLKQALPSGAAAHPPKPWWEEIRGIFKDDPHYEEAMRLGREWRAAQRPEHDEEDAPG